MSVSAMPASVMAALVQRKIPGGLGTAIAAPPSALIPQADVEQERIVRLAGLFGARSVALSTLSDMPKAAG